MRHVARMLFPSTRQPMILARSSVLSRFMSISMLERSSNVKSPYYTRCNSGLYKYAEKGDDSPVEVEFKDPDLDRLETDAKFTGGHGAGVVKAYRKRLGAIRAARDERD